MIGVKRFQESGDIENDPNDDQLNAIENEDTISIYTQKLPLSHHSIFGCKGDNILSPYLIP